MQVDYIIKMIKNSKIRYDFNELPEAQIQQLSSMLFQAARHYAANQSSIRNEICLAIVLLLLRWNGINNMVNGVVSEIGQGGNDFVLLYILSMLPIEVDSERVYLCIKMNNICRCPFLIINEKQRRTIFFKVQMMC